MFDLGRRGLVAPVRFPVQTPPQADVLSSLATENVVMKNDRSRGFFWGRDGRKLARRHTG
jgi:hypothetical protein